MFATRHLLILRAGQTHWRLVWLGAALALTGCRTQPYVNSHIESVNAEYRQLEDYVYALEDENARLQQQLEAANATATGRERAPASGGGGGLRGGLFRRPAAGSAGGSQSPAGDSSPGFQPPVIEIPGQTPPSNPGSGRSTTQRPELNFDSPPADTPPTIELPKLPASPATENEPLPLPLKPSGTKLPSVPEPISGQPTDKKVTHLFVNPVLSGGADLDGQAGDDGLRVVVEPRNAADQFVGEAGPLSIVLLDPDRQGDAARVARWDFDQSAMRQMLAASTPGRGIKLELPWPAAAPNTNRLKMFVRYEADDGRRLQADREIFLSPPGQVANRWTPRTGERQASAEAAVPQAAIESSGIKSRVTGAEPSRVAGVERGSTPAGPEQASQAPATPLPNWAPNR